MQTSNVSARLEQPQFPFAIDDTVRTTHSGRTGTVTHMYPDGSASVRWHGKPSDAPDLGHERVPRSQLTVADVRSVCVDGLRRAALAPTYQDALDVTGAALATVARIAAAAAPTLSTSAATSTCRAMAGGTHGGRRQDLARAAQRACLLFALIEGAVAGAGGDVVTLARIGQSLMADIGHGLEQPRAAGDVRLGAVALDDTPEPFSTEGRCHEN